MSRAAFGGFLAGAVPGDLGVRDGRLKPCPNKPNCVCSQSQGRNRVAPLVFEGPAAAAMARLKAAVMSLPRTLIVEHGSTYLRAEAQSRFLGFVDDLEFFFDPGANTIHVRSASRLGHRDFGVNRARVEAIRAAFAGASAAAE